MVQDKVWQLKAAETLNIFEKLNLAAPAYILQKQNLKVFLQELSEQFGAHLKAIYTLHG